MNACHCPTCGRALPKAKATAVPVDTSTMTDSELYAYFKRIAPKAYAVSFVERLTGLESPELHGAALAVRAKANPTLADLAKLHTLWRIERLTRDRAWGTPAIGTTRYNQADYIEAAS